MSRFFLTYIFMSRIFTTCIFDGAEISFLAFSVAPPHPPTAAVADRPCVICNQPLTVDQTPYR